MSYGFRREGGSFQEQCPFCGRFPSEQQGYYARTEAEPDFVSLFCNEGHARRYEAKGGRFIDGDGNILPSAA